MRESDTLSILDALQFAAGPALNIHFRIPAPSLKLFPARRIFEQMTLEQANAWAQTVRDRERISSYNCKYVMRQWAMLGEGKLMRDLEQMDITADLVQSYRAHVAEFGEPPKLRYPEDLHLINVDNSPTPSQVRVDDEDD